MTRRTKVRAAMQDRLRRHDIDPTRVNINTRILWEGQSLFDGEDLVVLASGFQLPSQNEKTGDMVQVSYFVRHTPPLEALRSGKDSTVCGDCPLRGDICYVQLEQGVGNTWQSWNDGKVLDAVEADYEYLKSVEVRYGAYGDPASVPFDISSEWHGSVWTGYTHAWRYCDQRYSTLLHASVEDKDGYVLAKTMGWESYRIIEDEDERMDTEVMCLNHTNPEIQCVECGLCSGTSTRARRDIANKVHGTKYKISNFKRIKEAA